MYLDVLQHELVCVVVAVQELEEEVDRGGAREDGLHVVHAGGGLCVQTQMTRGARSANLK